MKLRAKPIPSHLTDLANVLPPKRARALIISSVNDAAKWGETRLNRLIRETITLSRKGVDDVIKRNTTRDDERGFTQQINVTRKRVYIDEYKPRQTKHGLSVKYLKAGKRELVKRAFLSKKTKIAYRRKGKKRLPINRFVGPTVVGALTRRDADVEQIREAVGDRVAQRFESKLDYELQKIASKAKR